MLYGTWWKKELGIRVKLSASNKSYIHYVLNALLAEAFMSSLYNMKLRYFSFE